MYISGDIETLGLRSSPLYVSLSWPLLAKHKLHVTHLCFPLCTSTVPSHFSTMEHSTNPAIDGCIVLYCIMTIDFFFLPEFLIWLNNLRNLCFAHLCIYQQPPANSLVHNKHLFSQWPFCKYLLYIYLLVQGTEAKGVNQGTWFPST